MFLKSEKKRKIRILEHCYRSPLRPRRRPFLPYFGPYSPAIGTKWYKWTFLQQTMCVLSDYAVRIETGSSFSHDY